MQIFVRINIAHLICEEYKNSNIERGPVWQKNRNFRFGKIGKMTVFDHLTISSAKIEPTEKFCVKKSFAVMQNPCVLRKMNRRRHICVFGCQVFAKKGRTSRFGLAK